MNIRNINLTKYSLISIGLYIFAIPIGMYGRSRVNFSSDFKYNKYHFGVFSQILTAAGFMFSSKMKFSSLQIWQPLTIIFLTSSLINLCLPSYYEGIMDI